MLNIYLWVAGIAAFAGVVALATERGHHHPTSAVVYFVAAALWPLVVPFALVGMWLDRRADR